MVGKGAVDILEQQGMATGQRAGHLGHHVARRTIAGIPGDIHCLAVKIGQQALHIPGHDFLCRGTPVAALEIAFGGGIAQRQYVFAKAGFLAQHHLEAVVIGRVMRAGDHDAPVRVQLVHGIIKHRRGAQANAVHGKPAFCQPVAQSLLQLGRRQPPVIAGTDAVATGAAYPRAECPAQCKRILNPQRLADDAADVIFSQNTGVEFMHEGTLPGQIQ